MAYIGDEEEEKMSGYKTWGAALMAVWALALVTAGPALGTITNLTFSQTNFNQGAWSVAESEWGLLDADFTGASGLQYLNLVVDGQWVVRNAPLISSEGVGVTHQAGLNFDLGNARGTDVTSLDYTVDLGASLLIAAPTGPAVTAPVGNVNVTVGGRGGGLGTIAQAVGAMIGWLPVDWAFNSGMTNQDVGVDECVPGAFSNSLNWLAGRYGMDLPADAISVDGLKGPTHWNPPQVTPPELDDFGDPIPGTGGDPIPGTGGTPVDGSDWQGKRDATSGLGITTRSFTIDQIDQVIEELRPDKTWNSSRPTTGWW